MIPPSFEGNFSGNMDSTKFKPTILREEWQVGYKKPAKDLIVDSAKSFMSKSIATVNSKSATGA